MIAITPSRPQFDIINSRQHVNLFLAGQGSGKTWTPGIITAQFVCQFPKVKGLIAANTHNQLNQSTLFRIREVWRDYFNITEYSDKTKKGHYVVSKQPPKHFIRTGHNYESYYNLISFINGAVIYIGSLENAKALDGIEIGYAILDETKDTREEAVKEVILGRLRQHGIFVDENNNLTNIPTSQPFNPLYIFTSPAKVPWINDWFYLNDYEPLIREKVFSETTYFKNSIENKFIVICSTYLNQKNLPANYIDNQKKDLSTELQEMLIYGYPFGKSGGEFYSYFAKQYHVIKTEYNPNLPIWFAIDENVNPYLPVSLWQAAGTTVYCIDEITGVSPNNKITWVCKEFIRKYGNHKAGVIICGDATSRKDDVKIEHGFNLFKLIETELKQFTPRIKVGTANPSVIMRKNFINTVMEKQTTNNYFMNIAIFIGEHCTKTIIDLQQVKEDREGKKDKSVIKNPNTGITYQPYGHYSDCMDYFLCQYFSKEFTAYQNGNNNEKLQTYTQPMHNSRF